MYMYTHTYTRSTLNPIMDPPLGLYTRLRSPTLYGVCHKQEGSVGGRKLRTGRALVMQYGRLCRWGEGRAIL